MSGLLGWSFNPDEKDQHVKCKHSSTRVKAWPHLLVLFIHFWHLPRSVAKVEWTQVTFRQKTTFFWQILSVKLQSSHSHLPNYHSVLCRVEQMSRQHQSCHLSSLSMARISCSRGLCNSFTEAKQNHPPTASNCLPGVLIIFMNHGCSYQLRTSVSC